MTGGLGDLISALNELTAAVRANDVEAYRRALARAGQEQATREQIVDCYRWGSRDTGERVWTRPDFDVDGQPKEAR